MRVAVAAASPGLKRGDEMTMKFSVSRAIVTGGARGIGAAIAERLSAEGLAVAIFDLEASAAEVTAREIGNRTGSRVLAYACDVSDRDQVNESVKLAAQDLGGLDTMVTNAGITRDAFLHKMTDEQWDQVIGVHLTGTFACLRAAAPYLREQGNGRVVCISSVAAATGNPGQLNYSAAKGGIVAMVKTAAREFARSKTTVNCIRPGFIDTEMTRAVPDEMRSAMLSMIPLGRPGEPAEIAAAVAYFCSDDAAYVTGAILDVNGGFYM